ncbi:ABC transporter ATP-binding protein [Natrarchaeobius halalkaliphilus]|uniref:ABC transporter ATP-binding protein n=1 Tax=Natrarchaeobius halalkaliphilus TaxID=1679091 RepID=A0A3N6M794_9EURY|nr:ABC transporter ATP-binding protein [Natrarchaeobius halalkaliphilus]RQG89226.1 ABC transporter ATP-binding protein [Natrarchaeobius halalkaliphilus]
MSENQVGLEEKLHALEEVIRYRPKYAAVILLLKLFAALFEGIGLTFLLPIIETAQTDGELTGEGTGPVAVFVRTYAVIGVSATLETLLFGLAVVMTIRYGTSFLLGWMQASLTTGYMAELRRQSYEALLSAEVSHVDAVDGDEVVNTIVTETQRSARVLTDVLGAIENVFFAIAYASVALILSPSLTLATIVVLGIVVFLTRYVLTPGYRIGDEIATANEEIQSLINAGVRGRREVKLFSMNGDLTDRYRRSHDRLVDTRVRLERNRVALGKINQLLNAFVVFVLVYLAVSFLSLSLAALGVFLFAMFRLSPLISRLNNTLYSIDGSLPHLVRTLTLIDSLERHSEPRDGAQAPSPVTSVEFDGVSFRYGHGDENADGNEDRSSGVSDVSLHLERGETVALVGPSGAGKSTIVSLLTGAYEPDDGARYANGVSLAEIDRGSWQERVAVVPQHPYLFTGTLRYNVAIGNPEATDAAIERVCEISQVSPFLEDLPNGLDTWLGDDGVRLSGGQRQRVAIARALLTGADVLILDEATSELDSPTAAAIRSKIQATGREYATVVIGHWLSAISDADRIYTVVDGEIVESGTHRELIDTDSHYASLYESQLETPPST